MKGYVFDKENYIITRPKLKIPENSVLWWIYTYEDFHLESAFYN